MFECPAFGPDLHNRDHVRLVGLANEFRSKRSSSRGKLPCIINDRVKHVFEPVKLTRNHVKPCPKLPYTDAIKL